MKKIVTVVIILIGILYIFIFSYTAVFHSQPMGEPGWIAWEGENGYLRDADLEGVEDE